MNLPRLLTLMPLLPALLAGCSSSQTTPSPAPDPYANVNTVAHDRDVWQHMLVHNASIRRTLRHTETGVESLTESDDPAIAAKIKEHSFAMKERMRVGATVRAWDDVFSELFAAHKDITLTVTPTEKGVQIVESASTPESLVLLRSHAIGVSEFVRAGTAAGPRQTARYVPGPSLPPPELAIGGVPHRFLLSQVDDSAIASLKASGVSTIVSFRKPTETPEFNEQSAATSNGVEFCSIPYQGVAELSDDVIDQARATLRSADSKGITIALHCRTGNRIGPGWAAYRVLDANIPLEQAIAEAKAMQMKDPAMEARTREYITARLGANSR